MCKLWFNTIFVPESGKLVFPKTIIDRTCKDIACKKFKDRFAIEIYCKFE